MDKFARFCVRDDGDGAGLILGQSFSGILKADTVYEIRAILGELVIVEIGPSVVRGFKDGAYRVGYAMNWGADANTLVVAGNHLFTEEEWAECSSSSQTRPSA